ncbi:amino acid transporter [Fusarium mundagurra]|uniref:Amino acid transporter n=1 Tax=Fusarium mundagurra TaxID=1567541 RepID=A0A8H6DN47_9HYPO|nr:amino acid transporter [Fusarium mundagurra]
MSENASGLGEAPPAIPLTVLSHGHGLLDSGSVARNAPLARDTSDPPNGGGENPEAPERLITTYVGETEATQLPIHTVRRKLRGIHIFMIAVNGTLGTGLYVRSGQILELGGPLAVIFSFLFLGILTWAVMQCIAELLCLWPVPGAVPLFVRKFVDKELGDTVGVAYWYTYSIGFAALIATSASVLNYWTAGISGFSEGFAYIALPLILVIINSVKVEIYGWIEVVTGVIKLIFLAIIIICLPIAIFKFPKKTENGSQSTEEALNNTRSSWDTPFSKYNEKAADNWFEAFMMCLSLAIFAYAGIENIAVSVIEARWPSPLSTQVSSRDSSGIFATAAGTSSPRAASLRKHKTARDSVKRTIGFTAVVLPILVASAYTISGLFVSLGLKRDDCGLQRLSWLKDEDCGKPETDKKGFTFSPFILIAKSSTIPNLDHALNAFILFTALTCANTNLYVASRTLFGITRNIRSGDSMPAALAWFGVTNRDRVPLRAMVMTALAFIWVPFLKGTKSVHNGSDAGKFLEILVQMGSVSIIIIWACLCLAYARYHYCIHKFRDSLEEDGIRLAGDREAESDAYPYQSHWQPVLAYGALGTCLFILLVCNGVFLWKEFHVFPFLTGYLTTIWFFGVWVLLKIYKKSWSPWNKLDAEATKTLIKELNDLRDISLEQPEDDSATTRWDWIRRIFEKHGPGDTGAR